MSYRHSSRRKAMELSRRIMKIGIPEALKTFTKNENDRLVKFAEHTPTDRPERSERT